MLAIAQLATSSRSQVEPEESKVKIPVANNNNIELKPTE